MRLFYSPPTVSEPFTFIEACHKEKPKILVRSRGGRNTFLANMVLLFSPCDGKLISHGKIAETWAYFYLLIDFGGRQRQQNAVNNSMLHCQCLQF